MFQDILPAYLRMTAVRSIELIVKAAEYRQRLIDGGMLEYAELLSGSGYLGTP